MIDCDITQKGIYMKEKELNEKKVKVIPLGGLEKIGMKLH